LKKSDDNNNIRNNTTYSQLIENQNLHPQFISQLEANSENRRGSIGLNTAFLADDKDNDKEITDEKIEFTVDTQQVNIPANDSPQRIRVSLPESASDYRVNSRDTFQPNGCSTKDLVEGAHTDSLVERHTLSETINKIALVKSRELVQQKQLLQQRTTCTQVLETCETDSPKRQPTHKIE